MVDINDFIQSLKNGTEKFILTDEGDKNKFLGIEITHIVKKNQIVTTFINWQDYLYTEHRHKWLCFGNQRQIDTGW